MGLRRRLTQLAVAGTRVLLVEAPGAWYVRVKTEQEIARRGWCPALSPADADLLVVCGDRFSSDDRRAIDAVWDQMPGPRARAHIHGSSGGALAAALDRATAELLDDAAQSRDAETRAENLHMVEPDHGAMDHGSMDHGSMDHGSMDHGSMDHGSMDHGSMDMTGPGGIDLASGGPDRDGLDMDVLHLRLGPVLPFWPPGLVITLALQGDVIVDVVVDSVSPEGQSTLAPETGPDGIVGYGRASAARRCDAVLSVLTLTGAGPLAGMARFARDQLLDPSVPDSAVHASLTRLRRGLQRSWLTRWSLRDLTPIEEDGRLRGDVHTRFLRLVDLAVEEARTGTVAGRPRDDSVSLSDLLPPLLVGAELATARLAVASVVGLLEPVAPNARGGHG